MLSSAHSVGVQSSLLSSLLLKHAPLAKDIVDNVLIDYLKAFTREEFQNIVFDAFLLNSTNLHIQLSGLFFANQNQVDIRVNREIIAVDQIRGVHLKINVLSEFIYFDGSGGWTLISRLIDDDTGDMQYASFTIKISHQMEVKLVLPDIPYDSCRYIICKNPTITQIDLTDTKCKSYVDIM